MGLLKEAIFITFDNNDITDLSRCRLNLFVAEYSFSFQSVPLF